MVTLVCNKCGTKDCMLVIPSEREKRPYMCLPPDEGHIVMCEWRLPLKVENNKVIIAS